jgi:hypothetical protein
MGRPGSGNFYHWHRPTKKPVVEDCLSLGITAWHRRGVVRAGSTSGGTTRWTYPDGKTFAVGYRVDARDPARSFVLLAYDRVWARTGQADSALYRVHLTTSARHHGGRRWWFVCPLVVNDVPCGRRVGKLYLPPSARFFGCRTCHGLTYVSCQESGKYESLYRSMAARLGWDVADVRRTMNRIGKGRGALLDE